MGTPQTNKMGCSPQTRTTRSNSNRHSHRGTTTETTKGVTSDLRITTAITTVASKVQTTSLKTSSSTWTRETRNSLTSSKRSFKVRGTPRSHTRRLRAPHAHHLMRAQVAVAKEGTVNQITMRTTITNLPQTTIAQVTEITITTTKVRCHLMCLLHSRLLTSKNSRGVVSRTPLARNICLRLPSSLLSFLACPSFSSKQPRTTLWCLPQMPSIIISMCDLR
jgi:hypothetical protein